MVASQNGHVEVVDKLLQHGANLDLQEKVLLKFRSKHVITSTHYTVSICIDCHIQYQGFSTLISPCCYICFLKCS